MNKQTGWGEPLSTSPEGFTTFAEKRDPVFGQESALHRLGFEEFWPNDDVPAWFTK